MLKNLNTFKFKFKLQCYNVFCFKNRLATKLMVDNNKDFREQLEFFEDMNDNFGNFFAATNYMN